MNCEKIIEAITTAPDGAEMQEMCGLINPCTSLTRDARNAPAGEGPLAVEYEDKPHRVVYRLCQVIEALATIPGLSDVLDGKAVIVPACVTEQQLDAAEEAMRQPRLRLSYQKADDINTLAVAYTAMIAASPYRKDSNL